MGLIVSRTSFDFLLIEIVFTYFLGFAFFAPCYPTPYGLLDIYIRITQKLLQPRCLGSEANLRAKLK